nr:ovalbumin-related protein X-like isoform X1 [Leptinotarsa decemlineata]
MSRVALILLAVIVVSAADEALLNFGKGNIDFTAKSYQKEAQKQKGNLLVCGISAEIVLSLLAQGAKHRTKTELHQALSEDDTSLTAYRQLTPRLNQNEDDFKLLSANKLYAAEGFEIEDDFKRVAEDPYKAQIQTVNFAENLKTTGLINNWVADNTNQKITDLISPDQLSANTRLVLVNALYLNGLWEIPFEKLLTKKQAFHPSEQESKEIDMMTVEGNFRYRHCGFYKAQFLEMGLRHANLSFVIVLPDAHDGLADLESKLDGLLEVRNLNVSRLAVTIPKFTIRSKIDYRDILEKLGVFSVFQDDANLSGISRKEGLRVDFVVQQTYINVTEGGIEAAAATAVGTVRTTSLYPSSAMIFRADRPFIFFIRENQSGTILFVGKFTE